MNAVTQLEPRRSVVMDMADRFNMDHRRFEQTLRATIIPKETTPEEFASFLLVAREYRLNPITREIYAMKKKGGGIQAVVGVDGWSNLINSHPAFDGMDFEDERDDRGRVVAITCRMHRKDRGHPIATTEYLEECVRYDKEGKVVDTWATWPRRMLRHKAMIQAARYAFGFAGIVDPDEAARFTVIEHASHPAPPQPQQRKLPPRTQALPAPQPQPEPPAEEDELLLTARATAEGGTAALQAYIDTLESAEYAHLREHMDELQNIAAQADAGELVGEAG